MNNKRYKNNELMRCGRQAFERDDFESAHRFFARVGIENIRLADDFRKIAYCLIEAEEFADALVVLFRWEPEDLNNPILHSMKGYVFERLGRFIEAEEAFVLSLNLKPRASGYCMLGDLRKKVGNIAGASSSYQDALELDPDYWEAHMSLRSLGMADSI